MLFRFKFVVYVLLALYLCGSPLGIAQNVQAAPNSPTAPNSTPQKQNPSPAQAQVQPQTQAPAGPQIDTASIIKRANDDVGANIDAKVGGWRKQLDRIDGELRRKDLRYPELNGFRDELQGLRSTVSNFWPHVQGPLDAVQAQVAQLAPAPSAGQPPEPEPVASHRAELNYYLGILAAARTSVDDTHFRINQLINIIQDIRRANFTNNLFQPVPGIFAKQTWETVPENAEFALDKARGIVTGWWQNLNDKDEVGRIALEAVLLWLVLTLVGWWGVRRLRAWKEAEEPPFWKRASSAAGVILLRALPTAIPLIFLYNALAEAQPFPQGMERLFYAAERALIIFFAVEALIRTVFAPAARHWRLIPTSDGAAARMWALIVTLAAVYGFTTFIYAATRIVQAPFSLTVAVTLPASLIFAGLLIAILKTPLHEKQLEGMPSLTWMKALRIPIWLMAFAIIVTALSGYLALSRFMAQQLLVTGSILAVVYLLLLWVDGLAQGMSDESSSAGQWLEGNAGLDRRRREQLAVPVSLILKFAILVLSVPLILLQWGYPWADILEWYRQLFFGFQIGNTQVSLAAILASVIVFVLGYFAARLFQSWLDAQILKPAGLSGGLRDSIRTGVGYLGVFVAALIAFSYAGFNLSSLAIVAGAFSVGIGFGLQSVVSNFVSGLILLAERPIKVGDLVVVGGEEGYVRKISVRSTEIETFDRANVLIPNSFFITEKVKNWTLRNNTGRIVIPVGVAYGCDPRKVRSLLLQAAKDHVNVMTAPEPFVDFEDFAEDSLNFKLYAFIYDLTKSGTTRTDLRISILDAFKEAGITIPSRQTDVTLREIDWLRDAITQYMANGLNGKTPGNSGNRPSIPHTEPAE